jgi:hypothetical protein
MDDRQQNVRISRPGLEAIDHTERSMSLALVQERHRVIDTLSG